jgi:pimeloyl-ACP methyl ester carboxylesterase
MATIEVNGETISYGAEGSGSPVVLIHNLGTGGQVWWLQIPALVDRYKVYAVDCRGHGRSSLNGAFSLAAAAEDIARLIEAVAGEPAHVVGLSAMGGRIAISLYASAPDTVRSLVLADTNTLPPPKTIERITGPMDRLENISADAYVRFARNYAEETLLPETAAPIREKLVATILETRPENYLAALRQVPKADLDPVLATVRAPTLVLVGERDWRTPVARSEHIAQSIESAVLKVIPDAGHLSNLDNAQAFNAAVRCFLDGVEGN